MIQSFVLLMSSPTLAQSLELPALSPRAMVQQQVGVVHVTVDYASPGKRDRAIWGELVPYGELWRTGANRATTLEVTGDVSVGGEALPAGKYAVFTIPAEDTWTVILNQETDQGGTQTYDEALDALRIEVTPGKGPDRERLTFVFSDTTDSATRLDLEWAGQRVSIPIEADTASQVQAQIDGYVDEVAGALIGAARYHAGAGDPAKAVELVDLSLAIEESWFNVWLKATFLHDLERHKEAYKLAQQAQAMGIEAENFFWEDRVADALATWKKR